MYLPESVLSSCSGLFFALSIFKKSFLDPTPTGSRFLGLTLKNISYDDVVGMASDVIVYRDTVDTANSESFTLENYRGAISAIKGGTWPSGAPDIPLPTGGIIGFLSYGLTGYIHGVAVTGSTGFPMLYYGNDATAPAFRFNKQAEANDRFQIRGDGRLDWGVGGATALDTNLYRSTTNTLKTDDALIVTGILTASSTVAVNAMISHGTITALANDATPTVADRNVFLTGGTTTITDFDDGVEGQSIEIHAEHSVTITDGTNIFLSGSANFDMTSTDTLTLRQKADGKWYETGRGDNGA